MLVWLIVGAVFGAAAAWWLANFRLGRRLAEARTTAETIRSQSQARIATLESQVTSRDLEISDLKSGRLSTFAERSRRPAYEELELPAAREPAGAPQGGGPARAPASETTVSREIGEEKAPPKPAVSPPPRPAEPPAARPAASPPPRPAASPPPKPPAASPPRPAASAPPKPAGPKPPPQRRADDLTRIRGIGKVVNGKLNEMGITTLRQIANFTPADIERVSKVLDFPGRIEREKWVDQAKALLADARSDQQVAAGDRGG